MKKQKPSNNKDIVKADAPAEKADLQSTGPVEKTEPESEVADKTPDNKDAKQDQVEVETSTETLAKPVAAKLEAQKKPETKPETKPQKAPKAARGFPYFGVFNLLLIIGIAATAGYYWQMQQKAELQKNKTIATLQAQLTKKADTAQLQQRLAPLESGIGDSVNQISELQQQQAALQESAEKLFELYGRDESGWQLAEVE